MASKIFKKLIEVDLIGFLGLDDPNPLFKALIEQLKESIPEATINTLCNYCGPKIRKKVQDYVSRYVLTQILKNPNINIQKMSEEYRGALGIPKRFDKSVVRNYFKRAIKVNVQTCTGRGVAKELASSARRTKKGRAALSEYIKKNISSRGPVQIAIDDIAESSYRALAFRAGLSKESYQRDWLREADTGETSVDSRWAVWPPKGGGGFDFKNTSKYSRSGTHIMVDREQFGGFGLPPYDPNDYRPDPQKNNAIKSAFIAYLPNIINAASREAVKCIKARRSRIAIAVQKSVKRNQPRVKTISINESITQSSQQSSFASVENLTAQEIISNPLAALKQVISTKTGRQATALDLDRVVKDLTERYGSVENALSEILK